MDRVYEAAAKLGLRISAPKTKVVHHGFVDPVVSLEGEPLEVVDAFVYLGSKISGTRIAASDDVVARIGKSWGAFSKLMRCLWYRRDISVKTKMRVYNAIVIPTLLYSSECWTLLSQDIAKLEVFQMRCLRIILGISLFDRIPNDVTRSRCRDQETVADQIQKTRLRWLGHVCRMKADRLPKRLLLDKNPATWKCPRNAPKKQWKSQVLDDLRPVHLHTLEEIVEAAQYRPRWHVLTTHDLKVAATSGHRGFSFPCRR